METKALKAKRPGFTDERYNETSYYVEHGQYLLLDVSNLIPSRPEAAFNASADLMRLPCPVIRVSHSGSRDRDTELFALVKFARFVLRPLFESESSREIALDAKNMPGAGL